MIPLTSVERVQRFLKRQPHDRIPCYEHFWSETVKDWKAQGKISDQEEIGHQFDFDMTLASAFNMMADISFTPEIIEENEETVLTLDGNGAILRRYKKRPGHRNM
ncbi:MAG: hypothetical protein JXQ23_08695 [Clostridia bacterium]|nr:hypothetical protein [Clostridia bacterium]